MTVLHRGTPPAPQAPSPDSSTNRPRVTELRLSAFGRHRAATLPLGPFTVLTGPSGSGKSSALRALEALARLGGGACLADVFPEPRRYVPERAKPDAQQRRGFRIGCTVEGPAGPVHLDLAVQAEPELRIVGERLTGPDVRYLETALRDPGRREVQAAWHTAGSVPVTRGPLPDDFLGTALLPLRVAGRTEGQRQVLAAAEQAVVGLRSVFACDPVPARMRAPARSRADRLLGGCDNLATVLRRTRTECGTRHSLLVAAAREGIAGPVVDVLAEPTPEGAVRAVIDRGDGPLSPVERLGDGELRYLGLALVLLTGPRVLAVDTAAEVPEAYQSLTVLADNLDRALDPVQCTQLIALAARMCARGHIRLVAATGENSPAAQEARAQGATVVDLKA
ncbi:AAA family ATPase [Streptomyces sp. NPDC016845]|uniref:AAA family ATPase n=1 Tax=Streptomyces sp. NPDC016845 TaxID=3364972 RepID=UPI0037A2C430